MNRKFFVRTLVCVLLAIIALVAFTACSEKEPEEGTAKDRVYGDVNTGVTLKADATFVANLYHGVVKTGTYVESTDADGVTNVTYTADDTEVTGTIKDDVLTIPQEWADTHGHGTTFPLVKE